MLSTIRGKLAHWVRRAIGQPSHYVGDGVILARLSNGLLIYLDGADVSLTPSILVSGEWEPWVTREFGPAVRPGARVVDIGANCGYFALLAAERVGPSGKVVAVEANPRLARLIAKTFAVNGCANWAKVVAAAALDREGEIQLGVPGDYLGSASILMGPDETDAVRAFGARAAPLAKLLDGDLRVDVLKIDAEGAEPLIWSGAQDVLEANRDIVVFMEFAPPMIAQTRAPAEFLAQIRALGFSIDEVTPRGLVAQAGDAALLAKDWSELRLQRR
jgi:FkbM family methyltransferase